MISHLGAFGSSFTIVLKFILVKYVVLSCMNAMEYSLLCTKVLDNCNLQELLFFLHL